MGEPVWLQRDGNGAINGVYSSIEIGRAEEQADSETPEVAAYIAMSLARLSPPTVPQSISDWQFFQQLAIAGIITQDQALASNAAIIPPPLMAIIDAMPFDQQFKTKMLISGATTFERNHPITIAVGTAYGMTSDQIDAFFSAAAQL